MVLIEVTKKHARVFKSVVKGRWVLPSTPPFFLFLEQSLHLFPSFQFLISKKKRNIKSGTRISAVNVEEPTPASYRYITGNVLFFFMVLMNMC